MDAQPEDAHGNWHAGIRADCGASIAALAPVGPAGEPIPGMSAMESDPLVVPDRITQA